MIFTQEEINVLYSKRISRYRDFLYIELSRCHPHTLKRHEDLDNSKLMITQEIMANLPKPLPKAGLLNLFVKHTSCALSINENADPDVRSDMDLCEFRDYGGARRIVATIYE